MIRSMTGFGRARAEGADKDITVEIRAVNSRYFDCNVKAPRIYAPYEEKIKAYLQKHATTRGKVDVYVNVDRHTAEAAAVEVDMPLATAYLAALRRLADELSLPDDITVMKVAENRDLFTYARAEEDAEREWVNILYLPIHTYRTRSILWIIYLSRNMKHWSNPPARDNGHSIHRLCFTMRTNIILRGNSHH